MLAGLYPVHSVDTEMSVLPTSFKPDYSDLLAQSLTVTQDEWTALRNLHGPFGKWEHARKRLLSILILDYRSKEPPKGATAWTDKLLDAAAHADERYGRFFDTGVIEGALYQKLDDERADNDRLASYAPEHR